MLQIANVVGRLVEIRPMGPLVRSDFGPEALGMPYDGKLGPAVVCVDLRFATVADRETASMLVDRERLRADAVQREAIVLPPDRAVLAMQVARITRSSADILRHTFTSSDEARVWLGEVLSPLERARLATFLATRAQPRH